MLKTRPADKVTDKYPSSFTAHRGTLWGGSLSSGDLEDLLIFASAQVAVLREQMADISDLGYYSEHVASEAGRKVLSEVTERYVPYRKKKNWGERRESNGLVFKQNPHVS